jgi:hypothetical protein
MRNVLKKEKWLQIQTSQLHIYLFLGYETKLFQLHNVVGKMIVKGE